jgi:predicted ATPase/class 3 adenylate cyclase
MITPSVLEKLAAYVPMPVAQAIYRDPRPLAKPVVRRLPATVLSADITGFTPLSELLIQAGSAGVEEFSYLINLYFTQMVQIIQAYHGQVVKFSGDAMTVLFPAEEIPMQLAVRQAGECALEMQTKVNRFSDIYTSRGNGSLSMKVGIGVGKILETSLGGALERWEYVVGGDPIVQSAIANRQAKPGQIVLSLPAWQVVQEHFIGIPNIKGRGFVNLFKAIEPIPTLPPTNLDWGKFGQEEQQLSKKALQGYMSGTIKARLDEHLEWLAEVRPMTILYAGVGGLDYESDGIDRRLQNLLHATQEVTYRFEGSLNKIAVDDKGTVLLILFGAPPFSQEDNATRAIACALSLQTLAREQNLRIAVGITAGPIFTGLIGAPNQRAYTVIGDELNLASRLMQFGRAGTIIISERVKERAGSQFITEGLGQISFRGKTKDPAAYLVKREKGVQGETATRYLLYEDPLVGRKTELEQIRRMVTRARAGKLQPLFIEGELGLGKSRLTAEMVREWVLSGGVAYGSKCISYGQQIPYQSWREVLAAIFGITSSQSPQQQLDQLVASLANLATLFDQPNYWTDRLPLLADILSLETPENEFTRYISRELRRNNTFAMIEAILRYQAERQPLLILLEDIHWADELSLSLAGYLAQRLDDSPILLALVYRPIAQEKLYSLADIRRLPYAATIHLEPLSTRESLDLIRILSGDILLSPETEDLLLTRGQGNPLVLREITEAVLDVSKNHSKQDFELLQSLNLPHTVQDVIRARIDRLSEAEKLTLKIASVIGDTFKRLLLSEVHPVPGAQLFVPGQLDRLEREKLVRLETPAPKWEYTFHNVLTQEVVYEDLPPAQRRQFHAIIGEALEALAPDEIELLAFHYSRSDNWEKGLQYLRLASQKAHREYANQAAIGYYSDILTYLTDPEKGPGVLSAEYWDTLLERAKLYNLIGRRVDESEDLGTLGIIAEALADDRRRALAAKQWGHFYETMSDYYSGLELVERALNLAQQTGDEKLTGQIYNQLGKLLYLLGDYQTAHNYFQQALHIAENHQDDNAEVDCLNNLGIVAHYQADYDGALYLFQKAISSWQKADNQVGVSHGLSRLGQIYYDMGHYLAALQCFDQSLELHRKIGDRAGEALSQHNLGKIQRSLGKYETAQQLLNEAFNFYLSVGDRHREADSLCHIGFLYCRQGKDNIALHFLKEAIAVLREVNDPWTLAKALTYYGWSLYNQEQFQEARKHITEALKLERETQQEVAMVETTALLGTVALALNDLSLADTCAQHVIQFYEHHGTKGIEHPAMAYLACYHIFQANQKHERARSILAQAQQYVTSQANQINTPVLRANYLTNIPEIREIQALAQQMQKE